MGDDHCFTDLIRECLLLPVPKGPQKTEANEKKIRKVGKVPEEHMKTVERLPLEGNHTDP